MKTRTIILTVVLLIASLPLAAAYDAFLKLDGVAGESQAPGHQGWIELTSFSWGVTQAAATGGAGAGKCAVHDISITKLMDKSSPVLMQAALSGRHFQTATLEMAGERHMLQDVFIKSVREAAVRPNTPGQVIELAFAKCATHEAQGGGIFGIKGEGSTNLKIASPALKIDQKVMTNGMFTIAGGAQGATVLQDLHFAGQNSAIITVGRGDALLLPAVQRAFQSRSKLSQLTISAYQTGGSAGADHKEQYMKFDFHDVFITHVAGNQFTVQFGKFDGPMTGFHDVFPK